MSRTEDTMARTGTTTTTNRTPRKPRAQQDPEIVALGAATRLLRELDPAAQHRVVEYLRSWVGGQARPVFDYERQDTLDLEAKA